MIFDFTPASAGERIPWERSQDRFPWLDRLAGCPQDDIFHQEGDALVHTRMVCDALVADDRFWSLEPLDRDTAFATALLHDIAKPQTTYLDEEGRYRTRQHCSVGSVKARRVLYEMGVPFAVRETICASIRYHLKPFFLIGSDSPRRLALQMALSTRLDLLHLQAIADIRGRICPDAESILENIELYRMYCDEQGLLDGSLPFHNDHSRFLYFRNREALEPYEAHHRPRCEVTVLSGLPGSGKDHWVATKGQDLPVVSLDEIRRSLRIKPTDSQGAVIAAAYEQAKENLRRGQSFIWNATNMSRRIRAGVVDFMAAYDARVRLVYVEAPAHCYRERNAQRVHAVRATVLDDFMERWEVPDLTEAHAVEYVVPN